MRGKLLKASAGAGVSLASLVAACSLGLDASKLVTVEEAGVADVVVEVAAETSLPPGSTRCSADNQCGDQQCYSGKCVDGVCKIELCPAPEFPCQHKTCTADNRCSDPVAHRFLATKMTLGRAGLGCGGSLSDCVAIVYPFAFVGPKSGPVAAYPILDFSAPAPDAGAFSPEAVKIDNLDFNPTRIVASGERVWFLGQEHPVGVVPQVDVAWIDVPFDARLRTFTAQRGTITLPSQTSVISGAFAGADKGLILLLRDTSSAAPARATQLKVGDGGAINSATEFNSIPDFDGGARIVASTGDRLLLARSLASPPTAQYSVELIKNAGAANAFALGEKDLTAAIAPGALYPDVHFATTPQGGVVAQGAIARLEDGGVVGVDGVRVAWFLQQADDTIVESKSGAPAQVLQFQDGGLPPSPDPNLVGDITAIGEEYALALHLEGDSGTAVRVVKRDVAAKTAALDPASQTSLLAQTPQTFALRGAVSGVTGRSYGYAFSRPATDADGVQLTIFAIGCGN